MLTISLMWLWLSIAIIIGALLLFIVTAVLLVFSLRRGGSRARLFNRLMGFGPIRRLVVRVVNKKMAKGDNIEDLLAHTGLSQEEVSRAQELLGSLSDESRSKLIEMSLDTNSEIPSRREGQKASEMLADDLGLSRDARRRMRRAQVHRTSGPSRQKPKHKKRRK